ncbi:Rec8 like protein-domain-containing protein [Xylariomycetidae sp. FL2044]|nr:Rec8 like protein-domain-containing protein [Xylariomycetidae sp. FL2044]
MFYSHEILTSRQYGVATIWLVATIGKQSSTRRVSRKAIQEVDVQRACGKIIEPGAPIALRLQGTLLHGVSRVYNQQCSYMLTDVQKISAHMDLFFTKPGDNQMDPEAAKSGHAFIPADFQLPAFDLPTLMMSSQRTEKTNSQMSPLNGSQFSGSGSSGRDFTVQLDIPTDSPGSQGSPLGIKGYATASRGDKESMIFNEEDELERGGDWGLEVDEDGNMVESTRPPLVQDEHELPTLPLVEGLELLRPRAEQMDGQKRINDQDDVFMMDEPPLPEVEPLPKVYRQEEHNAFQSDDHSVAHAPARRKKNIRAMLPDESTQISRDELRAWQINYVNNCGAKKGRYTPAALAKTNAMLLTFGLGSGSIGQSLGVPRMVHPLAVFFSGDSLFTAITGLEVTEETRGRRRSASEAIEDEKGQEKRRVKPKLNNDGEQQARSAEKGGVFAYDPFVDNGDPEIGREAEAPMSDHHSSGMPWNAGSSAMRGSSMRGSDQKGRDLSSPTRGRADVQDIIHYSDDGPMGFGDDVLDIGLGSNDSSFDAIPVLNITEGIGHNEGTQTPNDKLFAALNIESQNFLSFIGAAIRENGEYRGDEDFGINRKWVGFNDLFIPRDTSHATAAQAFYHALCLTTKGDMYVKQDGAGSREPFGSIWLGIKDSDTP